MSWLATLRPRLTDTALTSQTVALQAQACGPLEVSVWRVQDALLEGERALVPVTRHEEMVTLKDFNTGGSQPAFRVDGR
jgi:hypothetical protein